MKYIYCPDCGERLVPYEIGDEGLVPYCKKCQKPWFDGFSTCVIAAVTNEYNEVALLRQDYMSTIYKNLVSGYMKPCENAEEAIVREISEEIGIQTERLEFAGTYWFGKKDMLMIGFIAYVRKTDFTLSGEVNACEWTEAEKALSLVHPEGSVSYALIDKYIQDLHKK